MMTSTNNSADTGERGKGGRTSSENKYDTADGDYTTTDIDAGLATSPSEDDITIPVYPTSYKQIHCYRGDSAFCLFVWITVLFFYVYFITF